MQNLGDAHGQAAQTILFCAPLARFLQVKLVVGLQGIDGTNPTSPKNEEKTQTSQDKRILLFSGGLSRSLLTQL